MLLTSSQVSIAVSSTIVILCTTALFLSGYVLQQRTLHDLREAIKPGPRPSPNLVFPDRFTHPTTELADGTTVVVVLDGDDPGSNNDYDRGNGGSGGGPAAQVNLAPGSERAVEHGDGTGKGLNGPVPAGAAEEVKVEGGGGFDEENGQKQMSRAERRRRIKEEIMKAAKGREGDLKREYRRRVVPRW